jgi:prepilin-type N-terminal cleavage/methylation domain-containing protein
VRRRGFTLLEVLISIALIAALLGSMFAFLFDMLSSRDRALAATARRLAASTLIEHLEAGVMTCLVGDGALGAGIDGDSTRLRLAGRGVAARLAERGTGDPAVLGDLQVAEYRFDEGSHTIQARWVEPGEPQEAAGDGGFETLGPAWKVRFRYRDSTGWRDSFDSLAEGRLPLAVEVAVWFQPWPGEAAEPPARLTFDTAGGFDAAASGEPRPDRFRVILVPDASAEGQPAPPPPQESPET